MYNKFRTALLYYERYHVIFNKIIHTTMTHKIISNASGTRSMEITEEHLNVIEKYQLFNNLVYSNGIVDETTLDTLKSFVGGIIDSEKGTDNELVNFYKNVLAHPNMKSVALGNLMELYAQWKENRKEQEEN